MSPVVDANLFVTAATKPEISTTILERLQDWRQTDEGLHAPWLFRYEVASAI